MSSHLPLDVRLLTRDNTGMFNMFKKCGSLTPQCSMTEIKTSSDFEELIKSSSERPVFFLKHSTRCPVSDWALTEFKLAAGEIGDGAQFAWLDLITHRDVSDEIARTTGIPHESPQLFWIVDGEVRGTVTHEEVKATRISEWLGHAA